MMLTFLMFIFSFGFGVSTFLAGYFIGNLIFPREQGTSDQRTEVKVGRVGDQPVYEDRIVPGISGTNGGGIGCGCLMSMFGFAIGAHLGLQVATWFGIF